MITAIIDDIFEYLKNILQCEYMSDMKFGSCHTTAIIILKDIDIHRIKPQQYTDICQYLGI